MMRDKFMRIHNTTIVIENNVFNIWNLTDNSATLED